MQQPTADKQAMSNSNTMAESSGPHQTQSKGTCAVAQLEHLKSLISNPPSDAQGKEACTRAVMNSSNTTKTLEEAMNHALHELTNTLAKHKDLYTQQDFRDVADEVEHKACEVISSSTGRREAGLRADKTENQVRERYRRSVMETVKYRKRLQHTAGEVRARLAREANGGKGRTTNGEHQQPYFRLFDLPPELWIRIARVSVTDDAPIIVNAFALGSTGFQLDHHEHSLERKFTDGVSAACHVDTSLRKLKQRLAQPAITRVCRALRAEALPLFYNENFFYAFWEEHRLEDFILPWLASLSEKSKQHLKRFYFSKVSPWDVRPPFSQTNYVLECMDWEDADIRFVVSSLVDDEQERRRIWKRAWNWRVTPVYDCVARYYDRHQNKDMPVIACEDCKTDGMSAEKCLTRSHSLKRYPIETTI